MAREKLSDAARNLLAALNETEAQVKRMVTDLEARTLLSLDRFAVNGIDLDGLLEDVRKGYTPSSATIIELINLAARYKFLRETDSGVRQELLEDIRHGWEYMDKAIHKAMLESRS